MPLDHAAALGARRPPRVVEPQQVLLSGLDELLADLSAVLYPGRVGDGDERAHVSLLGG
jgi:hypothetical protein